MPQLTAEALEHLKRTHDQGSKTLRDAGYPPESIETAIEVERHRWYWKPKQTKLVLVAESHVLTAEHDMGLQVDETKIRPFLRRNANSPPDHFVRLVYCLAYGESELLASPLPQLGNTGTPLYWDIFGRVSFRCPQPRREYGFEFHDRMRWKVDTLRELYRMGIWLLDASVHAIYRRNRHRLPDHVQQTLHEQWWTGYGRFLVKDSKFPKVWVIGKTVQDCLTKARFKDWSSRGWVYQTSAPEVDLNRNWPQLLEDCWRLRGV